MPKDFFGIEEVEEYSERSSRDIADNRAASNKVKSSNANPEESQVLNGGEVQSGDIEEVACTSQGGIPVTYGGSIFWENAEDAHRARMRTSITVIALLLWIGWTVVGFVTFALTKNPILLISSPVTATGVALYKILSQIVTYYFSK